MGELPTSGEVARKQERPLLSDISTFSGCSLQKTSNRRARLQFASRDSPYHRAVPAAGNSVAGMQTTRFAELELSRLVLGTAQFGMPYGIANKTGLPAYETARDILAQAYEGGVNCLDTAAAYGTSEDVLGRAMAELGISREMVVVTKVRPALAGDADSGAADRRIVDSVVTSLRRLRVSTLSICLTHWEEDFCNAETLSRLKDEGLIRHIGSSVMTTSAATGIIATGKAEALQIPANLLDHRFSTAGVCRSAAQKGIALFVRSTFLQGLLLMPEEEIVPELAGAVPLRRRLDGVAKEAGISLREMAARYVLGIEGATCALAGVESADQLVENLKLFSLGPLDAELMGVIEDISAAVPDEIIVPSRWPRRILDRWS